MSDNDKIESKDLKRIEKDRMNLRVKDLKEEEIDMILDIGLCFNPKTKKWDGSWIECKKFIYFINEKGVLTLPLGYIENISLEGVGLTSLHNFPDKVKYDVEISNNELKSLDGCPSEIGGKLLCDHNQINTLEDLNSTLAVQVFSCSHNKLTDLRGCPSVMDRINVSNNPLTSLKGMPQAISSTTSNGIIKEVQLDAKSTRLKNYAYITTNTFNITSLYKISKHERDFVKCKKTRKKKDRADTTIPAKDALMTSSFYYGMDEKEYYLELANFIVDINMEEDADEIMWHEDVLPNIKNLFSSMKSVNKFNL